MEDQKNAALESGAKVLDVSGTESGEARKTRQNDQHATLHSIVITAAAAIEQALRYAAEWTGYNPDECAFTVKPDFVVTEADAQQSLAQIQLWQNGLVAKKDVRANLRRTSLIAADRTDEMIDDELASESPIGGDNE